MLTITPLRRRPPVATAPAERLAPPRPLVEGPSAWTGSNMRETSEWIYRLSPGQIDELESAMRATQARGLDIADIGQSEFPLPTFGPELPAIRDEHGSGRGIVLIRGIQVERSTIAAAASISYGIGPRRGHARPPTAQDHTTG